MSCHSESFSCSFIAQLLTSEEAVIRANPHFITTASLENLSRQRRVIVEVLWHFQRFIFVLCLCTISLLAFELYVLLPNLSHDSVES